MKRHITIFLLFAIVCIFCARATHAADTLAFTIDEAVKYALEHNKEIETAKQKVKEAEASVVIARAGFFPTLSVSASYTRIPDMPATEITIPMLGTMTMPAMARQNNYLATANLQYPIFTWFAITNGYTISNLSLDIAKEDLRKTENDIKASVKEAFMGVQTAETALDLANKSYRQLQGHVNQAEELYNAGTISKFDFLRAKVQLTAIKVQVTQAKNGLALAKDGLKNYLNIDYNNDIVVSGKLIYVLYEITLERALSEALANRSEIKTMDLSVEIAQRAVDIAGAANKPSVVLTGNYGYKNPNSQVEEEWGTTWSATLAVNIPIFQGFKDFGGVDQAKAQLAQAKLGKEQLEKGLTIEIRNTYLQFTSSKDLLMSQQESVAEAKEALDIAAERYTSGLITNLEYLDAQVALSTTEMNYLKTLADYLIAIARLEKVMGR